jgi:hypothetical protein
MKVKLPKRYETKYISSMLPFQSTYITPRSILVDRAGYMYVPYKTPIGNKGGTRCVKLIKNADSTVTVDLSEMPSTFTFEKEFLYGKGFLYPVSKVKE